MIEKNEKENEEKESLPVRTIFGREVLLWISLFIKTIRSQIECHSNFTDC